MGIPRPVDRGLSPRLRGNRELVISSRTRLGSIPAPAGEPVISGLGGFSSGVYPRACGGTDIHYVPDAIKEGLSPRLRGNRGCLGARLP